MEVDFDDFKVHGNLLNFNVEKFKASIARLLPSRRPPTRSKLIKTRDKYNKKANDPNHRCYEPNNLDSECPVETTLIKEFESDNSPTDLTASPFPQQTVAATAESDNSPTDLTASPFPQQTVAATAAVAASNHLSPSAVTSPPQINKTLSQRKSISDVTLTPGDDNNVNSDSNKHNSKTRWLKLRTPVKADNDFPEAKSELESVLQRVLRSKGERFSSQAQQNTSENKEDMKIRPKLIESIVYPKRIAFVTEESLQETKQRLRHLDNFNKFGSQCEININNNISSIGNSSAVEPDNGICRGSRAESDKEDKCNSTAGITNNLTSDSSFNSLRINSSATDTSTYESDEWCDHRQSHDSKSVSNSSLKNIILSDIKPAHETNLFIDSRICQTAGLELPSTSMIRELTAQVMSHQDESRNQKTEAPLLMPKGADIFELLRKFEERVADEAATAIKPTTENLWKSHTSATDMSRRSKMPKDDNSITPAKVINDSWIRTTNTSPDPFQLDASTSSVTSIASANTCSQNRAWDSVETPFVTRSRVLEALESLRQSSNGSDFEPHSQLFRRSNDSQEMDDLASKPHLISGDHAKNVESQFADTFVVSQFGEKLSSPQASDQQKTVTDNTHGVEALPLIAEIAVPTSDIKKPKKVEFSKTEVQFVADEPHKMKTVKTNEKPLTTNLYRHKRRSISVSPKMLGFGSSCNRFGNHEQHKKLAVSYESIPQTNRRSSFNAPNSNYTSLAWPGDNLSSPAVLQKKSDVLKASGSTTGDNGQAVTISSIRPDLNNIRRASWSIIDENESNTAAVGYSTKISFEKDRFTEIKDLESRKHSVENGSPKSKDEEMSDKSHFSQLRIEEVKTVTDRTNVDIKYSPLISVAVNVFQDVRPEDTIAAAEKFATVLRNLNDAKKEENTPVPLITGAHDSNYPSHHQDIPRSKHTPGEEHIIPRRLADDRHCSRIYAEPKENRHVHRTPDTSTHKSSNSRAKTDSRPVTIIHHGVRLQDKRLADSRRSAHLPVSSTPKSELVGGKSRSRKFMPSSKEPKEPCHMIGIGGGSLRKKMTTTTASSAGRERLFDSGRDSWLNLPKECKSSASSSTGERKETSKSWKMTQPPRTGDTTSTDINSKHTTHSHHHSSRLPTPCSSRKSRKVELDFVGSVKTEATNLCRDARDRIASATYRDASNKEDMTSHQTTHRKQASKPLTSISKKPGLRLIDRQDTNKGTPYSKIRSTSGADITPSAKFSLARNTSNSSLGSRSNSYEFQYPVLKTEERSKQRAARMLQRAASREALIKRGHVSSSEDIPLASDTRGSKAASKLKLIRKVKSTKVSKPEATTQQSTRMRVPPKFKPTGNTKDGSISSRVTRPMR